jgi:hypothetical protein
MKNPLLCLMGILFLVQNAFGQPDKQWLIWNGLGKDGLNAGGNMNNYSTAATYAINNNFTLKGVSQPNVSVNANARNDIFVIYADNTSFNSRYYLSTTGQGFFYNAAAAAATEHNFSSSTGGIKYLYLTNRYEGDDLPEGVKVPSGNSAAGSAYSIMPIRPKILTADHDVVFDTDITVIIDLDSVRALNSGSTSLVTLKYDAVEKISDGTITSGLNFLTLQPAFATSGALLRPDLPNDLLPSLSPMEVTLDLNAHSSLAYINFRPNLNAQTYGPDGRGNAKYRAVFTLNAGGSTRQLKEDIRAAHDPNFIRVDSICGNIDDGYSIFYHIEYENNSTVAEDDLKIEAEFGNQFDLTCLKAERWYVGGAFCEGTITENNRKRTFEFEKPNNGVIACTPGHDEICRGFVEICVKLNEGIDVTDVNVSLRLTNPAVWFGSSPFPINRFIDPMNFKSNGWKRVPKVGVPCECCEEGPGIPWWGWFLIIVALLAFLLWVLRRLGGR